MTNPKRRSRSMPYGKRAVKSYGILPKTLLWERFPPHRNPLTSPTSPRMDPPQPHAMGTIFPCGSTPRGSWLQQIATMHRQMFGMQHGHLTPLQLNSSRMSIASRSTSTTGQNSRCSRQASSTATPLLCARTRMPAMATPSRAGTRRRTAPELPIRTKPA